MSASTTSLDLPVLPRALALWCMVDGHGRSQAASQVLLCVTNHPGTQLSSYCAHGFRGSGDGRGHRGWLVSNPQCLGLSQEDSEAGGDLKLGTGLIGRRGHALLEPGLGGLEPGATPADLAFSQHGGLRRLSMSVPVSETEGRVSCDPALEVAWVTSAVCDLHTFSCGQIQSGARRGKGLLGNAVPAPADGSAGLAGQGQGCLFSSSVLPM